MVKESLSEVSEVVTFNLRLGVEVGQEKGVMNIPGGEKQAHKYYAEKLKESSSG